MNTNEKVIVYLLFNEECVGVILDLRQGDIISLEGMKAALETPYVDYIQMCPINILMQYSSLSITL